MHIKIQFYIKKNTRYIRNIKKKPWLQHRTSIQGPNVLLPFTIQYLFIFFSRFFSIQIETKRNETVWEKNRFYFSLTFLSCCPSVRSLDFIYFTDNSTQFRTASSTCVV